MAKTTRDGHCWAQAVRKNRATCGFRSQTLPSRRNTFVLSTLFVGEGSGKECVGDFWWEKGRESMGRVTEKRENLRVWVGVERVQKCVGGACRM